MADTAIVTACFGGFDTIRPQAAQDIEVDWVCITDGPPAPEPWTTITRQSDEHPCMAAKRVKTDPWQYADADAIWIDSNTEITSPAFAREALSFRHDGIAAFAHPRRSCIYAEGEASLGAEGQDGKYGALPIREQLAHYRAEGHPENAGLHALGMIAWHQDARELGAAWMAECERWGFHDQLSFPPVCRRLGIEPGVFGHPQLERRYRGQGYIGNRWMRLWNHLK